MPNYLSPGVYVEEVSSGVKPISGVGTSTGAFVGIAQKGVVGKAVLVTSWTQFVREFGGFIPNGYLAYAVYGFFAEGGASCYVVRTCHYSDYLNPKSKTAKVAAVSLEDDEESKTIRVTAVSEGVWGDALFIKVAKASTSADGFKLSVLNIAPATHEESILETYDDLTLQGVEGTINYQSSLIRVEKDGWVEDGVEIIGSSKHPRLTSQTDDLVLPYYLEKLSGGNDGSDLLRYTDLIGDSNAQNGLHAFDIVDDINIVAIPELPGDTDTISAALNYCKNRKDCFFIADPPAGMVVTEVKTFKSFNSSYGALYYPWVEISDPATGKRKLVPPSGVVAGTYANTDMTRGVHKAPAGINEGYLDSVVGLANLVTKGEHDLLNPAGINVIRSLPAGICIWGARTLSADAEWRYVNVRRLLMYIEESLDKGTQWVVFEPNDANLWGKVKRNLTAFLTRVWRDGALYGSTADEAFYVKVDEENNPAEVREVGQLIVEVGVAPVKPAEFVIIRVSQKTLSK